MHAQSLWRTLAVLAALCFGMAEWSAYAQVSGKAFEGFGGRSKDPIQIEADELEVLDGKNRAIFKGNVKVRQGSSQISTGSMTVYYLRTAGKQQGDIERLEFRGGVVVTSGDNTVSGDKGKYWVRSEDVLLEGNVVVSQGENAAKGCKLTANLKTNIAKLDGCRRAGKKERVKTILTPGSTQRP